MLSVLFFADDAGRVVLSRDYRGDVGRLRVADFCTAQLRAGSGALARGDAPPVTLFDGSTFFVRRVRGAPGPLWLVGAANGNVNAALCTELLSAFERLLHLYFAGETLSASVIRGQAALVYALLDEVRRAAAARRLWCCEAHAAAVMPLRCCGCDAASLGLTAASHCGRCRADCRPRHSPAA